MRLAIAAICYNYHGRYEEALCEYNEAIRLNPKIAWTYEFRGLLYDDKGDSQKALHDYSQAIQLDPNSAEALYRRGLRRSPSCVKPSGPDRTRRISTSR